MADRKINISRKKFIKQTAAGLAAISSAGLVSSCAKSQSGAMPMRPLGKTGLQVSLLSFGGGSRFLRNNDGEWEPMLERAVELGINLFDTHANYLRKGSLSSEERFGRILPKYRKHLMIQTKVDSRTEDDAYKEFEQSLQRFNTDYIDILMIHAIKADDSVAEIEQGVYKALTRLKEQGVVKYIGFSDMNSAERGKELIEKLDFDVVLFPINPTTFGGFKETMLPPSRTHNVGTIAMKLFRNVFDKGGVTAKELVEYAVSPQGVASALVSHHGMDKLEENVRLVREIAVQKSASLDMNALERRVAHLANPHILEWARPDYRDGAKA